ncbi:Peptidoglycan/LPS O-acetylase OafA/YrhL, contains acyltransferase and SGNH-hydrolase domains [Chitinophaga costaii]|uniref:Peptidoglycan/LPS O-acetylase OafA/YrhL, contains acyltransferase and SGNH-hydrolase domains n=1 Tax=Chitinophaga costaii TaxID=1335309 RepID=A0A1C4F828_9BACT|nr:Peptidoglycan/LPS O-acetylase OafA/YrhL, contains acyltransferase and SGNH-hydrolase domains [Chitinophaga costaii]
MGLPFAKHYLTGGKRPELKTYFLRRVTRLEPPYILVMILLFTYIVFVQHKYAFGVLLPDLLHSLTYTFNFFHPRLVLPTVNPVAWSLEIEVQFYILATLLAAAFFKSTSTVTRRTKIIQSAVLFILLKSFYQPPFRLLYDQVQYFLIGFLLADLYLVPMNLHINPRLAALLGGIMLFAIWLYAPSGSKNWFQVFIWGLALPFMIFILYYVTLFTPFWKAVFSKRILVTIGGMCYTIYLIHCSIIFIVLNSIMRYRFSKWYAFNWVALAWIVMFVTLLISIFFFLLVEKPFMEKIWYKKLLFQKRKHLK